MEDCQSGRDLAHCNELFGSLKAQKKSVRITHIVSKTKYLTLSTFSGRIWGRGGMVGDLLPKNKTLNQDRNLYRVRLRGGIVPGPTVARMTTRLDKAHSAHRNVETRWIIAVQEISSIVLVGVRHKRQKFRVGAVTYVSVREVSDWEASLRRSCCYSTRSETKVIEWGIGRYRVNLDAR